MIRLFHLETIFFTIISLIASVIGKLKPLTDEEMVKKMEGRCQLFGLDPYFDPEMVVGKHWRMYHTWGIDLENKCLDVKFKYADAATIDRIANDMSEYLAEQPDWNAATLVQYVGGNQREILLFPYRNVSGRFSAVSNFLRRTDLKIPLKKGAVPTLKYFLKLLSGGRFLLSMDCHVGLIALLGNPRDPPYRADLQASVADLGFDPGNEACLQDKNENEYKEDPEF